MVSIGSYGDGCKSEPPIALHVWPKDMFTLGLGSGIRGICISGVFACEAPWRFQISARGYWLVSLPMAKIWWRRQAEAGDHIRRSPFAKHLIPSESHGSLN